MLKRTSSKDTMASRRYICSNGYRWMITCSLLFSLTARSVYVYGYSQCYIEAEKASIPAALMCYNNHVIGPRVIMDVFRAKESSTTDCDCTVTSDTPNKFNFSTYNNYHPGTNCGSSLLFSVNGNSVTRNCYMDDMQLPSSNYSDTSVDININGPKSAISTDYCVLIESGDSNIVLNLSCNGDVLPSTTQTTPSTLTTTTTTLSSSPAQTTSTTTLLTTSKQSITNTKSMASTATSTPSKASTATMSSTDVPSTNNPSIVTTVQSQPTAATSSKKLWGYMIPVIGGLILVLNVAIVMAVCYNHRKSRKNLNKNTSSSNANLPYSRDYTYGN